LKFPRIEESIHFFPKLQGWRMTSFKHRQIVTFKKIFTNPDLLKIAMKPFETDMQQDLVQEVMRYQIEAPAIGVVPAIDAPAVVAPAIGSSSFATEIGTVMVRVCSQLKKHGKMLLKLDDHVALRGILEVANALMVDDDAEVGREINFNAISFEYGGDLLEWRKGEEKDNDDKKDVEDKVKSEEEEVQEMEESKNGDEKVHDVAEEDGSKQPTVVVYYTGKKDVQPDNETTVVAEVAKTDIVFFNQEEVVGEAYQASADQTTVVSVEEQTLEIKKTEDEASQEVFEGKDDDNGNSQNKPDPEQVIRQIDIDQTNLVLMESEVDLTLKKRYALNEEEINERAVKMACQMNRLYTNLDELLLGVLLESFIQRPISQDEKN
ncbi:hypothetical protein GIB67_010669, partial [Kingdonia uniflora]